MQTSLAHLRTEILSAERRIRPHVRETYLEYSPDLFAQTGAQVYLKLENLQHTGSFKVRGALNKVLSLSENEKEAGVVTASTGNHGAAVAFSAARVGTHALVFVPKNAAQNKLDRIRKLGAEVRFFGADPAETEVHARNYGLENGLTYVSPYNDLQVVAGQGTIAVELLRQLPQFDTVFVALGGGGLISGVAAHLKSALPDVRIWGCSPAHSNVMMQSVQAGRILDLPSLPTLSDATAGGVEPGAVTFGLCSQLVDEFETVTEAEIAAALKNFVLGHNYIIEGAAGVALAGFLKRAVEFQNRKIVIIICGANLDRGKLRKIL